MADENGNGERTEPACQSETHVLRNPDPHGRAQSFPAAVSGALSRPAWRRISALAWRKGPVDLAFPLASQTR